MWPLLLIHICTATIGLIAGALSMVFRKGSSLHRLAGNFFFVAMILMSTSAAIIAGFFSPNMMNVVAAILMFYLVTTSWLAAKRRDGVRYRYDVIAFMLILTNSVASLSWGFQAVATGVRRSGMPTPIYFIFGSIALLFAVSDARMLIRGGVAGTKRLLRHLWRMSLAFLLAMMSFYPGQAKLFPRELRETNLLTMPLWIIIGVTIFWLVRVSRSGKARRAVPATATLP